MSGSRKAGESTKVSQLLGDIHAELRAIIDLRRELSQPLQHFQHRQPMTVEPPHFRVALDLSPSPKVVGLRVRIKSLHVPDEPRVGKAYALAGHVWHLKDRLHQLARVERAGSDVNAFAEAQPELLLCADWQTSRNTAGLAIDRVRRRGCLACNSTSVAAASWSCFTMAHASTTSCS